MGEAAESVARAYGIPREAQDDWARRSHERFLAAAAAGLLGEEIVPVPVPDPDGRHRVVDRDETLRRPLPPAAFRRLPPAFRADGTVTAGNACRHNDGAAAQILAGLEVLERPEPAWRGVPRPLGRRVEVVAVGVPPDLPGTGPMAALRQRALRRPGAGVHRRPGPASRPGALALGHPYAATGAILLVRLLYGLDRTGGRLGAVAQGSSREAGDGGPGGAGVRGDTR